MSWVFSSAGRASPLQGEGRGFDPLNTHQLISHQAKIQLGYPTFYRKLLLI